MQKWSGGTEDPWILNDVADWMLDKNMTVEIPTNILGKFGAMEGMASCSLYVSGVLKAILNSPLTPGVQKESSHLYTPADIESAAKGLKPKILEACGKIKQAEEWLENHGTEIPAHERRALFGLLQTRSFNHIHHPKNCLPHAV